VSGWTNEDDHLTALDVARQSREKDEQR